MESAKPEVDGQMQVVAIGALRSATAKVSLRLQSLGHEHDEGAQDDPVIPVQPAGNRVKGDAG